MAIVQFGYVKIKNKKLKTKMTGRNAKCFLFLRSHLFWRSVPILGFWLV